MSGKNQVQYTWSHHLRIQWLNTRIFIVQYKATWQRTAPKTPSRLGSSTRASLNNCSTCKTLQKCSIIQRILHQRFLAISNSTYWTYCFISFQVDLGETSTRPSPLWCFGPPPHASTSQRERPGSAPQAVRDAKKSWGLSEHEAFSLQRPHLLHIFTFNLSKCSHPNVHIFKSCSVSQKTFKWNGMAAMSQRTWPPGSRCLLAIVTGGHTERTNSGMGTIKSPGARKSLLFGKINAKMASGNYLVTTWDSNYMAKSW